MQGKSTDQCLRPSFHPCVRRPSGWCTIASNGVKRVGGGWLDDQGPVVGSHPFRHSGVLPPLNYYIARPPSRNRDESRRNTTEYGAKAYTPGLSARVVEAMSSDDLLVCAASTDITHWSRSVGATGSRSVSLWATPAGDLAVYIDDIELGRQRSRRAD